MGEHVLFSRIGGIEAHAALRPAAQAVLRANHTGRWTKPSPVQYPHQWNWDSGFISLGWSTFDWEKAALEIESMLSAQWIDGMVPHVHYDTDHLVDYFPGPDRWPGAEFRVRQPGELTSGISNPPVLAIAAERVGRRQPDPGRRDAFWRRVLPPLTDWLGYLLRDRRMPGSPLVTVVHPWETGWDNSPRWDLLAAAGLKPKRPYQRLDTRSVGAAERPTSRDYDAYIALAEIISEGGFDLTAYRSRTPFLVHDVLFDSLTLQAGMAINRMAREIGADQPVAEGALDDFARAFEELHWNAAAGAYLDYDARAGRQIEAPSAAGIAALAGGARISRRRAAGMYDAYLARSRGVLPVPTVPADSAAFDPNLYWRGPVWVNVNWLVIEGLAKLGLGDRSTDLAERTLAALEGSDFAEYLNPVDGEGRGVRGFSWSAALALDLLEPS